MYSSLKYTFDILLQMVGDGVIEEDGEKSEILDEVVEKEESAACDCSCSCSR